MNELIEAAYRYLGLGLPIIALTGKTPNVKVHRHGLHDAFTPPAGVGSDPFAPTWPAELEPAFGHRLTTGIGIVIPYPYLVVDIDSEEGAVRWKEHAGDQYMPDRWVAKTAHGLHLWYSSIEATGSFKLFGRGGGVDIKGQQSYVAVEPSMHPGDATLPAGQHYRWLLAPDERPPKEAPDALLAAIRQHNFDVEGALIRRQNQRKVRHQPLEDGRLWASVGFEHLIEGMGKAGPGNRNNYLHWAAATMAEEGATDEEFDALKASAREAGLTSLETRRTIRSARARHG